MQRLALLDPELAGEIRDLSSGGGVPAADADLAELVEAALQWISLEVSFGYAAARGWAGLLATGSGPLVDRYRTLVAAAAGEGPHLARLMAEHLPPVLTAPSGDLPDRFLRTVAVMRKKGAYTLKSPLEAVSRLLADGDPDSAAAFLDLLETVFSHEMPYGRSLHLAHDLPRSILAFAPAKRPWQIRALTRVAAVDIALADPFLQGLERGIRRLNRDGLHRFVREGLAHHRTTPAARLAQRFFSLDSRLGLEALDRLRVSVTLPEVQSELTRYVRARTGFSLSIRALSEWPGFLRSSAGAPETGVSVFSDGQALYLPEEIDRFGDREQNRLLYKCLAKLESALYEFGAFDFDLERAADRYGIALPHEKAGPPGSDLARFLDAFPCPDLARDLFTVFEHGRLRLALAGCYPGLLRQVGPLLRDEVRRIWSDAVAACPMARLYAALALGLPQRSGQAPDLERVISLFSRVMTPDAPVEAGAFLVRETYGTMAEAKGFSPLPIPFGRRLGLDLPGDARESMDAPARDIKETLEKHGVKVYKADIRAHLARNAGRLDLEKIASLTPSASAIPDLAGVLAPWGVPTVPEGGDEDDAAFRHREWDFRLQDYLPDHVRVREHRLADAGSDFYADTLVRYPGTVRRIRYAFELLRPQGLTLLRQWVEGDDFDYRALLDFAVDRKAGRTPSDRLYIKRVKGQRDVAVLLLVDLSRSTANAASGGEASVLDVEKSAIVLFCEALRVVGDAFAVAGFSGTGRLGVDYYRIKDFEDDLNAAVKGRIAAMTPRRSTRMGAAIRHGTDRLAAAPAAVRILLVLGDGFPNDVDYKRDYAIEDTRKAILEASARRIHTRAITVNIAREAGLDDLYGPLHHNVISDVRELPDKLLRIYSALTET